LQKWRSLTEIRTKNPPVLVGVGTILAKLHVKQEMELRGRVLRRGVPLHNGEDRRYNVTPTRGRSEGPHKN